MIVRATIFLFNAVCVSAALAVAPLNVTKGPQVILTLLIDDLGYFDTSVWNPAAPTPTIGSLANEGLRLERQYAYWYCSPTRRSFLSGRFPAHIGNGQADICSNIFSLNFTLLSEKLKQARFNCHMIGKGHLGYETEDHLPINRGFDSYVGYLWGGESYVGGNHSIRTFTKDFWHDHKAGDDLVDEVYYSTNFYSRRAVSIIEAHDVTRPLWIHLAYQAVHMPYDDVLDFEKLPYDPDFCGGYKQTSCAKYGSMLSVLDTGIANVTNALRQRGLWDSTLVLFVSDNGGTDAGNNYPLRGQKGTAWEGGTRVAAFLSGGFLPTNLRGKRSSTFIHVADWYPTLLKLVGVDPSDTARCAHDIDGIDVWPLLTQGANATSPREFLPVTSRSIVWKSQYKLLVNTTATHDYTPNRTIINANLSCDKVPCLFDLLKDPGEKNNLAPQHPDIVGKLQTQLDSYVVYTNNHMSAAQIAPYTCYNFTSKKTWPWGPPTYRHMFAGPCCLRHPAPPTPNPPPTPAPTPTPTPSPTPPSPTPSPTPTPPTPSDGWTKLANTDCARCDVKSHKRCGGKNSTVAELEACCDATPLCVGFNTHGFLKGAECSAHEKSVHGVDLYLRKGPHPPSPSPSPPSPSPPSPSPPSPSPSPPSPPGVNKTCVPGEKRAPGCCMSAVKCNGLEPPFALPEHAPDNIGDWHYPDEEPAEAAANPAPTVVSMPTNRSAVLRDKSTGKQETVALGAATASGWVLLFSRGSAPAKGHAWSPSARRGYKGGDVRLPSHAYDVVVEHRFRRWSTIHYLAVGEEESIHTMRSPVGLLPALRQPRYDYFTDLDESWFCKQDVDPTDWLSKIAQNISGGHEPTFGAAASVMAPNPDAGLIGNPEDLVKFVLTIDGGLESLGQGGARHKKCPVPNSTTPYSPKLLDIADYLPPECSSSGHFPLEAAHQSFSDFSNFSQQKSGMVGRYLRAVVSGMIDATSDCAAEIMAVAAPPQNKTNVSTALVRVYSVIGNASSGGSSGAKVTRFLRVRVNSTRTGPLGWPKTWKLPNAGCISAQLLGIDDLGDDGGEFYDALAAQALRWDNFVDNGARATLPGDDRRYTDMALALLTAYQNLDRRLTPEYGAGKFNDLHDEFIPTDTLAIAGALLEWGQHSAAQRYLDHFLTVYTNSSSAWNASAGLNLFLFGAFGHPDSDADYGRVLQLFAHAVYYSGDLKWAQALMPIIEKITDLILAWRKIATDAFPPGSPLHGIHAGPPEADFSGDINFFFSINVWGVRGLLEMHRLLTRFPTLSGRGASWTAELQTAALEWRHDIGVAANFTAVRDSSAANASIHFLSPCVGSLCSGGKRCAGKPPNTMDTMTMLSPNPNHNLDRKPNANAYADGPGAAVPLSWEGKPKPPPVPTPGGIAATCIDKGTCFQDGMTGDYSYQLSNYANFRFFSETLLGGVLAPEYELAIMRYRETHRGTLIGMTRFRDSFDDMPILGYGWGDLHHDRIQSFHTLLAGHSANYLSRGTHWGTEQRHRYQDVPGKWRNHCRTGGEDCSLCMLSSVAPAMWIRWMLVFEDPDTEVIHLARGAPRRWFEGPSAAPFSVLDAPTRQARISFSLTPSANSRANGWVAVTPNPNPQQGGENPQQQSATTTTTTTTLSVRVCPIQETRGPSKRVLNVTVVSGNASLRAVDPGACTALFDCHATSFNFTVYWHEE